ncbi:MAG TPA: hypothetical protein VN914_01700 [Polyangia bacterium]|nr:hypothetical protein [Polyangia bacterium]
MKTSVPCPACGKSISVLRVATAPTPLHLRCPHCLRPLQAKNLTLPLVVAGIALGILIGRRLIQEVRVVNGLPVKAVLLALVIVVGADLLGSLLVVNLGKLTERK